VTGKDSIEAVGEARWPVYSTLVCRNLSLELGPYMSRKYQAMAETAKRIGDKKDE
jgi:hypothetical protein